MAAKKIQGKNSTKPNSTSRMPKTKRNLGPTDSGQAQRMGGLKSAGDFFAGKDAPTISKSVSNMRNRKLRQDMMKAGSRGGKTTKR
jgi:hypothetical protein